MVSVRIPQPIIDRMDSAIATGMYRNRADYIMAALRQFDDGLDGKGAPGGGWLPSRIICRMIRVID